MPPICWHMVTAIEAAVLLSDPLLEENLGGFLLGSTAPDIRVMTNAPREETHYYDLSHEDSESGLVRLFQAIPHLSKAGDLTGITRAFVAGYLTHLAVDEMWIEEIYRPWFGKKSPLADDPDADILDRVLQFEMDRRERLDRERMERIRAQIASTAFSNDLGFIEIPTINQWRERVSRIAGQEPSWEMFRGLARRYFGVGANAEAKQAEEFMAAVPLYLKRGTDYITAKRLEAFRAAAVARSREVALEYLA